MKKKFPGTLMIAVLIALGVAAFAGERTEYRSGGKYIKNRSDSIQVSRKMRNFRRSLPSCLDPWLIRCGLFLSGGYRRPACQ